MTKLTSVLALLALASLLALAFASELEFSNAKLAFTKFMHKFEKFYGNDDFVEKFKHFSENLRRIKELNKQEGGSAVYGITRFADLSPEQFKNRFLMRRKSPNEVRAAIGGKRSTFLASATDLASLPDSIDWRLKGAVMPVKNQGGCGSCWAFSTVGNIEGRWFLAGNPLVAFSEQQLVDCDRLENEGCNGGLMVNAFRYVMKMGLSTEKSYPYEAFEDSCKSDIVQLKNGANITSYEVLSEDEETLAAYLARNGPIAVALNADKLQFYHSGIIDSSHTDCDPMGLDHAVLLVGYGSENGKSYWIVKNSWGTSWGEHGYFRISRGKSTCGINLAASSAII